MQALKAMRKAADEEEKVIAAEQEFRVTLDTHLARMRRTVESTDEVLSICKATSDFISDFCIQMKTRLDRIHNLACSFTSHKFDFHELPIRDEVQSDTQGTLPGIRQGEEI